jgi:hypothetical protein
MSWRHAATRRQTRHQEVKRQAEVVRALGGVVGGLSPFACSGGGGEGERGVSGGAIALPGEFPVRDDERGVLVEQFADLLGDLTLAVDAAFTPDGTKRGGVVAAFGGEMSATPRQR